LRTRIVDRGSQRELLWRFSRFFCDFFCSFLIFFCCFFWRFKYAFLEFDDLLCWCEYASDDDYVFASETMRGKQPYWPDNLMKRHIRPVAKATGINKNIGWHTFRHSFGTLLKANGEDVKTVQELLRHANSRITLDVYTQAVNSNKRAAQSKVVRMMVSSAGTKVANVGTTDLKKQAQNAG